VVRRGHKRSVIAIAHKMIKVIYSLLKAKMPYRDPGIDYKALVIDRNASRWIKNLKKYGYIEIVSV